MRWAPSRRGNRALCLNRPSKPLRKAQSSHPRESSVIDRAPAGRDSGSLDQMIRLINCAATCNIRRGSHRINMALLPRAITELTVEEFRHLLRA